VLREAVFSIAYIRVLGRRKMWGFRVVERIHTNTWNIDVVMGSETGNDVLRAIS
jgi:hypothetical protein